MEQQKINDKSSSEDLGATIRCLGNMLDRANVFAQHLDTQTNILIGLSSAIFLFSVTHFQLTPESLFWLILGIFAAMAAFIGLLAVHPPRFMRKRGQEESLLYNKKITGFDSHREYANILCDLTKNRDALIREYSAEIYNLYKYYYRPKRKLFNSARNILITGILLSLSVLIIVYLLPA